MTSPHIAEIQHAVAKRFGRTMVDMVSDQRARIVARPRQVAMYLCCELTTHSTPVIGKHFGDRDHTTVMHARRQIGRLRIEDRELAEAIGEIVAALLDPDQGTLPLHR